MMAINDLMLIETSISYLLRKYFKHTEFYSQLEQIFIEVKMGVLIGQYQDMTAAKLGIDDFDMDIFKTSAVNKAGYSFVYFPVGLAMIMNGYKDPKLHNDVKDLMVNLGTFYEALYDFYDYYGGYFARLEETDSDIENGALSWLIFKAMEIGSEDQKLILKNNYGKKGHAEPVKLIYEDLKLHDHLLEYQRNNIEEARRKILLLGDDKVKSFLLNVVIGNANKELSNLADKKRMQ